MLFVTCLLFAIVGCCGLLLRVIGCCLLCAVRCLALLAVCWYVSWFVVRCVLFVGCDALSVLCCLLFAVNGC